MHDDELILGPFQGKPACVHIQVGKGVCGTAVLKDETQIVKDVHQFPGHIACDSESASEIVVPLHDQGHVVGVLDIDSPVTERFDKTDDQGLVLIAKLIETACVWVRHTS
jgi:L-methionine (R)-S-oxide reductase